MLASNWKASLACSLHKQAKVSWGSQSQVGMSDSHTPPSRQAALDHVVKERKRMATRLGTPVAAGDLFALREVLELLLIISDLQLVVDEQYLPVEKMYQQLL